MTRSKTKVKRSARKTVPSSSSGSMDHGPHTTRDSQGGDLFTWPSDGNLVYLQCCVPGCGRANYPNAIALRSHVRLHSRAGLYKIKGLITSNTQANEVCGEVTSGQEEPSITARDQPFRAAHTANLKGTGVLPSPSTDSYKNHLQNKACSRSMSDTEARSGATVRASLKAKDSQCCS